MPCYILYRAWREDQIPGRERGWLIEGSRGQAQRREGGRSERAEDALWSKGQRNRRSGWSWINLFSSGLIWSRWLNATKSNLANLYKPCFHSQVKSQYQKRISDCQVLVNKYKVDIESKNDEIRKLKLHVNASSGLPTNSIEYFLFAI